MHSCTSLSAWVITRMESLRSTLFLQLFSPSALSRGDARAPGPHGTGLPAIRPGPGKDPDRSCLVPGCFQPRGLCLGRRDPSRQVHVDPLMKAASHKCSLGHSVHVCPLKPAGTQTSGDRAGPWGFVAGWGRPALGPLRDASGGAVAGGAERPLTTPGSSPPTPTPTPALADFDEPKRSTFVMFGVLTIAVRIYHDRWGYGVYSGPIGTAVLIIATKWVRTSVDGGSCTL